MSETIVCPQCNKPFTCNPGGDCWCKSYPAVKIPEHLKSDQCLCRCELDRLVKEQKDGDKDA